METSSFFENILPLTQVRTRFPWFNKILRSILLLSSGDPCPDVIGMASPKKLQLLNKAVAFLPKDGSECYLEVGTFQGKSLIAALLDNPGVMAVACDDFSQFDDSVSPKNLESLRKNIARYRLSEQVRYFNCDFRELLSSWQHHHFPPVGVYFYDGAHDEQSQYLGIRLVESLLADQAVVIVDDWRYADDSQSYAEAGTKRAIGQSKNKWSLEHVLPARFNGDLEQWWNGVAVLSFQRMDD